MFRTTLISAVAIAACVACGPSFRRTYESDNAFERCFDIDYNPSVSVQEKESCWSEWLEERVYNQPDDKVGYAKLRLEEIDNGISVPGPPGPEGAFDKRPAAQVGSVKEFDSEKTAEKTVADAGLAEDETGTDTAVQAAHESAPPVTECEKECKTTFATCQNGCVSDTDSADDCMSACEKTYRSCMQRCFSD